MDTDFIARELLSMAREVVDRKVVAGKSFKVKIKGEEAVEALVGKIRGFDSSNGVFFYEEEGNASINGLDVVEFFLDNVREVKSVRTSGENLVVSFDIDKTREFMESLRSDDYSDEDIEDELEDDAVYILKRIKREYGISVEAYDFIVEGEPDTEDIEYSVVVSNVGTVYQGYDEDDARSEYEDYVELSESGQGRAGGEDVTLFVNGDIEEEHIGDYDEY